MCRNIRNLYNFKPPATGEEIRASSLQFVRKLSGFNRPSKANEETFDRAVEAVAHAARELIESLVTTAPPRDPPGEADNARARAAETQKPRGRAPARRCDPPARRVAPPIASVPGARHSGRAYTMSKQGR